MSLRIWLPLNGDLGNNGINQYEITTINTISWVDGKIGKAVRIGNGNQVTNGISINSNLEDILAGNYSITVWIKPLGNHVHYNGAIISSGDWNNTSAHSKWSFGVSQDNTKVDVLCTGYNTYLNCSCPVNEWTHLACVYNGTNVVKLYKNGEYVGQYQNNNFPTQRPTSSASNTTIGRETYANGYFSFNGCINDLRIYDHALSEKEIKKISQGLILHYPLNRNGFGQENLITQAMINADPWKSAIQSEYTVDGITGWILRNYTLYSLTNKGVDDLFSGLTYEENTQYTLSLKWRDDYRTDGKSSSIYFRFKYTDGTQNQIISPKIDYWQEAVLTSTAGKTISSIVTTYGNGGEMLIADLKLERGGVKTPYSPITNGDKYTMVGLDDNIEYVMSGYNHNGTYVGDVAFESDSPKYNTSVHLLSTNTSIATSASQIYACYLVSSDTLNIDKNTMTIAFWGKLQRGYRGAWDGVFCTSQSSGNDYTISAINQYDSHIRVNASDGSTYLYVIPDFTENEWHHYAFVYDGINFFMYKDGVKYSTSSFSSATTLGPFNKIYIGLSLAGGGWRKNNCNYSDFRIYATALSQADIAELYSIHRS